jgi:hypothetical protein
MELLNSRNSKQGSLGRLVVKYYKLTYSRLLPNFEMQILPLFGIDLLLPTLFAFQREMVQTREATVSAPKPKAITALLPYCSTNPPIPEHLRNILSDVCPGISGLAQAATTEDGQQILRHWLPETGEAEDIIGFWEQEFYLD